jgi:hypothetical protein
LTRTLSDPKIWIECSGMSWVNATRNPICRAERPWYGVPLLCCQYCS